MGQSQSSYGGCCGGRRQHGFQRATARRTWIYDLPKIVHTGDVILFSSKHSTSNITRTFTQSEWDHIGIIVKPDGKRCSIVEWGGGLFACNLVERLEEYHTHDGREVVLRQLNVPPEMRRRMEAQIERYALMLFQSGYGQNRAIPVDEVVKAARRQLVPSSWFRRTQAKEDDLTRLFCSKTVTVIYKSAGLIDVKRSASNFLPKHYSLEHQEFLELQKGAALGPELPISFESASVRAPVVALLKTAGASGYYTDQIEAAAIKLQAAFRRKQARREAKRVAAERRAALAGCLKCVAGTNQCCGPAQSERLNRREHQQMRSWLIEQEASHPPRAGALSDYKASML